MNKLLIIFLALCLISCRQNIGHHLDELESFSVEVYDGSGSTRKFEISAGSENYESLRKWLSENEQGWTKSPASYVPGVVVSYDKTQLNFINNVVVLNNENGQYTKPADREDYGFLLQ